MVICRRVEEKQRTGPGMVEQGQRVGNGQFTVVKE